MSYILGMMKKKHERSIFSFILKLPLIHFIPFSIHRQFKRRIFAEHHAGITGDGVSFTSTSSNKYSISSSPSAFLVMTVISTSVTPSGRNRY